MSKIIRFVFQDKISVVLLAIALIILSSSAVLDYLSSSRLTCKSGNITVNGSTALAPLVAEVAQDYQHNCSSAKIRINPSDLTNGSFNGLTQVAARKIDIGTSDVFADSDQANLQDHQVAIVIFALVINNGVTVFSNSLSTDQIRGIYSGAITNWSEVGGRPGDIVTISRPPTSGTRATFEKYVLNGVQTVSGPQSLVRDTNEAVAKNVQQTKGAIGYVSLYYAQKFGLTILPIDGNPPTPALVKNNTYKFWNIEHMYTNIKGHNTDLSEAFITYMSSDTAKQVANRDGYLDILDVPPSVLASH